MNSIGDIVVLIVRFDVQLREIDHWRMAECRVT